PHHHHGHAGPPRRGPRDLLCGRRRRQDQGADRAGAAAVARRGCAPHGGEQRGDGEDRARSDDGLSSGEAPRLLHQEALYLAALLCIRLRARRISLGGFRAMTEAATTHGFGCACHPSMTYTPVSRRKLLAGAGALAAASALPKGAAQAQAKPKVIDTHHHFYAPAYQKAWLDWEDARKIPHFKTEESWSREKAIEELDKNGVATGILSLASTPGTWFNLDAAGAARMARDCNDFGAEMVRDHKGRFGLFATLSMLDIDATLKEIE